MYIRTADYGDDIAQARLGYFYDNGLGVEQSSEKALEYYIRAADKGNVYAQYILGLKYETGFGVDKSLTLANKYYQLAAEQGYEDAQSRLDDLKQQGLLVQQSYSSAVKDKKMAEETATGKEEATNETKSTKEYSVSALADFCQVWNDYYLGNQTDLLLTYTKDLDGHLKYINIFYNNENKEMNFNSKFIPSRATILFAYNPIEYYFGIKVFSDRLDYELMKVTIDVIDKDIESDEIVNEHGREDAWSFMLGGNDVYNLYTQESFTVALTTNKGDEEITISKSANNDFFDMVMKLIMGSWYAEKGYQRYMDEELLPLRNGNTSVIEQTQNQYSFKDDYDAIDKAAHSLFYVEMYGASGEWLGSNASGFVTFDEHMFVTNQHVIDGASYLKIWDEDDNAYVINKVAASDKDRDIAILVFPEGKQYTSLNQRTEENLKRGQPVMTIGSPKGFQGTVDDGIISAFHVLDNYGGIRCIQFSASISPGSSGGALFNNEGNVIGVTTATITDGQNLNFAIPISEVQKMYEHWDKHSFEILGTERSWNTENYHQGEEGN